jgi:hypothetical protein
MSQQIPPQKEGQQNDQKQQKQQQPMEKPAIWSMDFSSICGDGNGQNAMKVRKWEVIQYFGENLNFLEFWIFGFLDFSFNFLI